MVKVSIEVRKGAARFSVAVQAESIGRAVSIVGGRHPEGNIRVPSPMAGPFVEDPATLAEIIEFEQKIAA
jgi:hypothetical protein